MIISTSIPPGNIVKELELYKRRIFSLYGTISSLALPVFSLYHRTALREALKTPKRLHTGKGATGKVFSRRGALYLRLKDLMPPGETTENPDSQGMEAFPGELDLPHLFLMAWAREGFSQAPTLPEPPRLSWHRWEYRNYEITFAAFPRWWERVYLFELPLDKGSFTDFSMGAILGS